MGLLPLSQLSGFTFPSSCADIDALDNDSYTPLLVAAAHGQTDAMKLLIERGAPIDDLDKDGKSVVFIASEENHQEVLKVGPGSSETRTPLYIFMFQLQ